MMESTIQKRLVLGVTGGIAAYKSADLVRRLRERGFDVWVVMSRGAMQFVTPLTLQAVSGRPVRTSLLDTDAEAAMGHIELSRWADGIVVAPASAHFLAKLANGLADDLLSTLCLATDAPIVVAPAMNNRMWAAAATAANVQTIEGRGVTVWGPASGDQACGEVGPGRLIEPTDIAERCHEKFQSRHLSGLSVLVTAGPTREAVDPVRYITNHSSGKMGYAVAAAAQNAGAEVTLVTGPTDVPPPSGVNCIKVESACEMFDAVMSHVAKSDIFIGAAAVADYRPRDYSAQKIKKGGGSRSLALEPTKDILAHVAGLNGDRPFTVGFAAETDNVEKNAQQKLRTKDLDMIAANLVGVEGRGFGSDENALNVYWDGGEHELALGPKDEIARALVRIVARRFREKDSA